MGGDHPPATDDYVPFQPATAGDKFRRELRDRPVYVYGIGAGIMALGGMAYSLKTKGFGSLKPSLFLIHTRLAVQGAVIGVMVFGMLGEMHR